MAAFEKGHKKAGGRAKGTPNKATESIKDLLNSLLPDKELARLWKENLHSKDPHVAFEAFKLANYYLFGRPVQAVEGELAPPIRIDISAIPHNRERVRS